MAENTRIVRLEGGQQREQADNTDTVVVSMDRPAACPFETLFLLHYDAIRATVTSFGRPGVAIVAIDLSSRKVAGSICVAGKAGEANAAIIGRHSMTDLFLDTDQSLSLRHLAVVVDPLRADHDVRFRIIDLRTRSAFEDEIGQRYEALVAEGPIFVRLSNYALYCLVTDDQASWPERAEEGWACIPERIYLRQEEAEPDRWRRGRPSMRQRDPSSAAGKGSAVDPLAPHALGKSRHSSPDPKRITMVQAMRGPTRAKSRLLAPGELPIGNLRVATTKASQVLIIGAIAAQRGILLGRYDRCDTHGAQVLTDNNISRVHLLVLGVGDMLYAIDTASTNGTWLREDDGHCREIRIMPLVPDVDVLLGEDLASLRWIPS